MTNPKKTYKERKVLTNKEIDQMLSRADEVYSKDEYRRLRVKALIAIAKKTGKRRSEIARLKIKDVVINDNFIDINFILSKKIKKGLQQYIKSGLITDNSLKNISYSELINNWKTWVNTKEGHKFKEQDRIKTISVQDKYAPYIIDYYSYVKTNFPQCEYLFPSNTYSFGYLTETKPNRHLSESQLLKSIKPLNNRCWLHLFRETKGAEIAQQYKNDIAGVTAVKRTLDLSNEKTAWHYIDRYAKELMTVET